MIKITEAPIILGKKYAILSDEDVQGLLDTLYALGNDLVDEQLEN